MNSVRINISLPKETFKELSKDIEPRKRSRFITQAVMRFLKEIKRINKELEGVISDGLD